MRILVIEDQRQHQEEARKVLEAAGHEVFLCDEAEEAMRPGLYKVDAIITDLYLPLMKYQEHPGHSQDYTSADNPCGLLIAAYCQKKNIPFVICTAGYHHGNRYEWANQMARLLGWKLVDGVLGKAGLDQVYTIEAEKKDWLGALKALEERIAFPFLCEGED